MLAKVMSLATAATLVSSPVFAMGQIRPGSRVPTGSRVLAGSQLTKNVHTVPEIDASAGFLTIAAVAAVLLLVWERNRRMAE